MVRPLCLLCLPRLLCLPCLALSVAVQLWRLACPHGLVSPLAGLPGAFVVMVLAGQCGFHLCSTPPNMCALRAGHCALHWQGGCLPFCCILSCISCGIGSATRIRFMPWKRHNGTMRCHPPIGAQSRPPSLLCAAGHASAPKSVGFAHMVQGQRRPKHAHHPLCFALPRRASGAGWTAGAPGSALVSPWFPCWPQPPCEGANWCCMLTTGSLHATTGSLGRLCLCDRRMPRDSVSVWHGYREGRCL